MMRLSFRPVAFTLALVFTASALTGCKKEESASSENAADNDGVPDIALSAAPNVAFSYAYRFALAGKDIAAVQEKHAAACEALGLSRCRITGIVYRRDGKDRVQGELALALAPDVARKFGKDATLAVEAAKGTLGQVEIGGEDKNGTLTASADALIAARAERQRLEKALDDRHLSSSMRSQLASQLAEQRAAEHAASREGRDARASVASTPMRLTYSTDGYLPGFSLDHTARGALGFAATVLNGLLAAVIVLITLAVPLGILLLGFAHGRRLAEQLWRRLAPAPLQMAD
jgi:hypothetical protein